MAAESASHLSDCQLRDMVWWFRILCFDRRSNRNGCTRFSFRPRDDHAASHALVEFVQRHRVCEHATGIGRELAQIDGLVTLESAWFVCDDDCQFDRTGFVASST